MKNHLTYNKINILLKELKKLKLIEDYDIYWKPIKEKWSWSWEPSIEIWKKLNKKSLIFMKQNYNAIVELINRWYVQIEYIWSDFDFEDDFEKQDDFFPKITSKWENFLTEYKNILRKIEYNYIDNNFLWSIFLWFSWWVISYILIEIIKKLINS